MKKLLIVFIAVITGCFDGFTQTAHIPVGLIPAGFSSTDTFPSVAQIYETYEELITNPDSILNPQKRDAMRWMSYVFPYYNIEDGISLNSTDYFDAHKSAVSEDFCGGSDLANWVSDGPNFMPDWGGNQQSAGWVESIYNDPNNVNTFLIGTRTSGILKSDNGGMNWYSVTDNMELPVLGVRQIIGVPDMPNRIIAITGNKYLDGGELIYSNDGGNSWNTIYDSPEFYWVDFHPSINGLMVAVGPKDVLYSIDYGVTWASFGIPLGLDITYKEFTKIICLNDKFFITAKDLYSTQMYLYRGDFVITGTGLPYNSWSPLLNNDFIPVGNTLNFVDFSNKGVGNKFYLQLYTDLGIERTYESIDGGNSFSLTSFPIDQSLNGVHKNELIASLNDPNIVYHGSTYYMSKYDLSTGAVVTISGLPGNNGHHDDYRSSHIINDGGMDRISFGNDGGGALVVDGLVASPKIQSINGDISNNLIHAFHLHERTGRIAFAFQDHAMRYRDPNQTYSSTFIWEGSAALIQNYFPDAIVGENGYNGIKDKDEFEHPIVNGVLGDPGECDLGGYFINYRHFPERFARGLKPTGTQNYGKVAMNKGVNVSIESPILMSNGIGPVAICERNPNFIYAADFKALNDINKFYKSTDDGLTWTSLVNSTVTLDNGSTTGLLSDLLLYNVIRAIAVDHHDADLVYCGIGGTHKFDNVITHERFRVIRSFDGGQTFEDYSEGLPALPVERLLSVDSDNDLVFCATSMGVFYRTKDMGRWECFSEGLPNVQITGMQYDYCNNTLYVSTYGRGLWKSEVLIPVYSEYERIVSNDETWNSEITLTENLRIESGSTLTIESTVYVQSGKKIIVEQDARLIINGGTITSACGGFWLGIEVWGNSSQSQFGVSGVNAQGEVLLHNHAVIEHAEVAVRLIKPGDWTSTGGFVRAYSSTFKNNKKDIEFGPYSNDYNGVHYANKSRFNNCEFYWDDEFRAQIPLGHVTMYKVDGIVFSGCDFADKRDVTNPDYLFVNNNFGIKSIDAKYKVTARCTAFGGCSGEIDDIGTSWDPSTFTNLYFGIWAKNSTNTNTINVDRCLFIDNAYGVQIEAVPSPVIIRNKFIFTDDPAHFSSPLTMHGIHAVGSKILTIEENQFIDQNPGTHFTLGVVCSNLGEQIDHLYKNTFTDLVYGVYAQGKNRNTTGSTGLFFECNENFNNKTDHKVVGTLWVDDANSLYGVKAVAGSPSNPTGVLYSIVPPGPSIYLYPNYYNTSQPPGIKVWYHPTNPPSTGGYNVVMSPAWVPNDNDCPSELINYSGGFGKLTQSDKASYESEFNITSNLIALKEAEYLNNQLDATEISYILNEVANLAPNNKQDIRQMLNSYSPYLTTEILFSVADNTPSDFNHPWLRDLLLANIEAVTPELVDFLGTKEYPLPAPMRQEVANGIGTTYTAKTLLEAEISQLYEERAFYSYRLIAGIQHDTDYVNTDSLRHRIILQNNLLYQQMIIDTYLQDDNFAKAKTETDNFAVYALSAPAEIRKEILDFVKLKRWMLVTLITPGKIASLGSNDLIFLRDMAENGVGTAQYQAQNILCFFYDECDYNVFNLEVNQRSQQSQEIIVQETKIQPKLSIYPNPAANWVMIELEKGNFENLSNVEIVITDITGKLIHQTILTRTTYLWETGEIENGVYLIIIKSDEGLFATEKIIVNK